MFSKIREDVLKKIVPSEAERKEVISVTDKILEHLNQKILNGGLNARAEVVGSIAKDTWISNDRDIDIFIVFDKSTPLEDLKRLGLEFGRIELEGFTSETAYANHPYTINRFKEFKIDVVPCYDSVEIITAVDRTPHHTKFVKENIGSLKDDVRLLKQFMKGVGVYSSEQKIQGFAGYLCEILIINYNGFENVLKSASKWNRGEYIDLKGGGSRSNFKDPLIVIDPVDPKRNVASALSLERLSEFIHYSRLFLNSPLERYFQKKKRVFEKMFPGSQTYAVVFNGDLLEDIIFPQLRKSAKSIFSVLERNDFKPLSYGLFKKGSDCGIVFEIERYELSPLVKHFGPRIFDLKNYEAFVSKHRKIYIEEDRVYALRKRSFLTPKEAIRDVLSLKEGLGKNLKEMEFKILEGDEAVSFLEDKEFEIYS